MCWGSCSGKKEGDNQKTMKAKKLSKLKKNDDDFKKLLKEQAVCDELSADGIVDWYKEYKEKSEDELIFFLSRITDKTSIMFDLPKMPAELDRKKYMLQAAVKRSDNTVIAVRLISYNTIEDGLNELLGDEDYIMIKE